MLNTTLDALRRKYRSGSVRPSEFLAETADHIERTEEGLQAFITLEVDAALERARELDREFESGVELSPLAGIPAVLKDNMCTRTMRTTCGSRMLEDYLSPFDATVVERLGDRGCLNLGKTNMDEFAMGSSTENSAFFTTSNPWDLDRVPGGSSGGAAAAVAARQAVFALGSDTGGSIRQPAAFCGVVGMKPTYGRVSRYGLVAFSSSLDQIGPITRDMTDCALVLNAICGRDKRDSTSSRREVPDFTSALVDGVDDLRIAVAEECFSEGLDPGVEESVREGAEIFSRLGAECEEVSLPAIEYALPAYYIISPAEASSNLARFDGVRYGYRASGGEDRDLLQMYISTRREGFGSEVKRRIMLGTYALSSGYYDAYYLKAQKTRRLVINDFRHIFSDYDLILTPTTPGTAFRKGAIDDPLQMYLTDLYTAPVNLAGLPAVSIPVRPQGGLPVGMQLVGRGFDEETIIRAAHTFQCHTEFHTLEPGIAESGGGV